MRKVERAPNPNAKKRADTLAYGGGQRFGPFFIYLDVFCCGSMIVKVVPLAEDMTSMRPP